MENKRIVAKLNRQIGKYEYLEEQDKDSKQYSNEDIVNLLYSIYGERRMDRVSFLEK